MSKAKKQIIGSTLLYSIGEIVPRILAFLLMPVLTKHLSPADYGITSYTTTIMTFVYVIASLSLNTFLLRNYYLEKTEDSKRRIVGAVFVFICLFNVVLLVIQFAVFPIAISAFKINIPFYPFFLLAIINNFFDVIAIIPMVLYRIKEDPKGFITLSLSKVILQFALTYILIVKLNQGLIGTYMARLYINIPFVFVYLYVVRNNGIFTFNLDRIKAALTFSLPLLPASLSYLIVSVSDRIILERFIPLNDLGIYSVAFTLSLALNIVIQALYKTFEQVIFKKFHDSDFQNVNLKLYKIFSIFVICGGFAIAIFSREIFLMITSPSFFEGHKLVPAMVIAVIITGLNTYLGTLFIAANKRRLVAVLTTISAIVCITFNLIFVPLFGYWGSIYTTIFAVSIISIVSYLKLNVKTSILWYQAVLILAVFIVPFYLDGYLINTHFYFKILIKLFITLTVFIISFPLLGINMINRNLLKLNLSK